MSTIRVGVVGVGHLGYHHARIYGEMVEDVELVGVVDANQARGAKVAGQFGVSAFGAVRELIDAGVDAVSVVAPTRVHGDIALELLGAGIDVLVEKPIAEDLDQASAMVEAAAAGDRILQVGHVERFNGAVVALLQAVKRPKFIECHRLSPYPNRGDDVSVVYDLMIHDLDIVSALDGTEVRSVDGVGVPVFSQYEDIANARIRFASGCVANLTCSRVSLERMRKIRVFERDAYVSTDYSAQEVVVYRKKLGKLAPGGNPMDLISIEPLEVHREEPLKLELHSFARCVRDRTRPAVSGEEGLAGLRLAQRVVDSIRENP